MDLADLPRIWPILWTAFLVYIAIASFYLILENREHSSTFSWLMLYIFLPVVGVVIYYFFGRDQRIFSQQKRLTKQAFGARLTVPLKPLIDLERTVVSQVSQDPDVPRAHRRLVELLYRTRLSVLTLYNEVEILQDASVKYPRLIEDIKQAKHSIHLEYFIWQADPYMQEFGDLLIRKAQEGVKVRVIYDALGSLPLNLWRHGYVRRLRGGGVEIYAYRRPKFPFSLHTLNYRNHRKIAVIDGRIGYTGGLNMGEEHLKGAGPYKAWRDTHLRLTGGAVAVLQAIFITSWYNTTHEEIGQDEAVPVERSALGPGESAQAKSSLSPYFQAVNDEPSELPVQIVVSGPDSEWFAVRELYFFMILAAEHHVYIQSPVFVPDSAVSDALKTAALSGVDVRIMCAPRDTAYSFANWAANTYFLDMVRAGVKVYLYQPAYLHAKTLSIDSTVCTVGTTNADIRSFQVNYEINAVLYDETLAHQLEADFERDLQHCVEFSAEEYRKRNIFLRFRDSVSRLLSPLL